MCLLGEITVSCTVDSKHLSCGRHLSDVFLGDPGLARGVTTADEEGHWHLVDFAHVDFSTYVLASVPLRPRHRLIEAVCQAKLSPVLLVSDRDGLAAPTSVDLASDEVNVLADGLNILRPVLSEQLVDAVVLQLHKAV